MGKEKKVICHVTLYPSSLFSFFSVSLILPVSLFSFPPSFFLSLSHLSLPPFLFLLLSSFYLCHHFTPPASSPSLFPFLLRREMCCSLVCSPYRLTSVCPSHLAALLRSHLHCCVAPPPVPPSPHFPPANHTTTSLHMVSSSFCSTKKRHPSSSNIPAHPPSAPRPLRAPCKTEEFEE